MTWSLDLAIKVDGTTVMRRFERWSGLEVKL
jgi:hypothetical protein